jgi:hypothetical protein
MSDFGQGAVNNDIGWGQGASNNDIGWGFVHGISWSPSTNLVGSPVPAIVSAFEIRVLADGGTFEAESCLITKIQELL